jgi:hypothetical protein
MEWVVAAGMRDAIDLIRQPLSFEEAQSQVVVFPLSPYRACMDARTRKISAIYHDLLTGNVARQVRKEKGADSTDLVSVSGAPDRNHRSGLVLAHLADRSFRLRKAGRN